MHKDTNSLDGVTDDQLFDWLQEEVAEARQAKGRDRVMELMDVIGCVVELLRRHTLVPGTPVPLRWTNALPPTLGAAARAWLDKQESRGRSQVNFMRTVYRLSDAIKPKPRS